MAKNVQQTDAERALAKREQEAAQRGSELDALAEQLEERSTELDKREAALVEQEQSLAERIGGPSSTDGLEHPLIEQEGVSYAALPDPQAGNGFVVVEAPLPLVAVFAALHPSERHTISAQMASAMRQTLAETGKLRRGEPVADEPIALAVLSAAAL